MKTTIFLSALTLFIGNVSAQVNEQAKANDISSLKKSNATLKSRVNEQKLMLTKQTRRIDSLGSAFLITKNEVRKSAENQLLFDQSLNQLKGQFPVQNASPGRAKLYFVIGLIGLVLLAIWFRSLLNKQIRLINNVIKRNQEDFNDRIEQSNKGFEKELVHVKATFERYAVEIKQMNAKQNAENKENINTLFSQADKLIENRMTTVKDVFNEQFVLVSNDFRSRLAELKSNVPTQGNQSNL